MKSGAADGTLSISVEPLYSAPGQRLNFLPFSMQESKVDPTIAEAVRAYLTIKYEAYSIKPA